jgi:branched-chain amino acid transport system ATP-binding protein
MTELLELHSVTSGYGDSVVLDRTSFSLSEGKSLAVLGRNGVGKTTLLLTLMGLTTLHGGTLRFLGRELGSLPTHRRAAAGIGWVPQERGIFASLTVEEHLSAVARPGPWNADRVLRLFPSLEARRKHLGNRLSGGEQQMVAIGRALVLNPRLLLLDEPMEGLAPIVVQELKRVILRVCEEGMTIILVEQHARLALSLTQDAMVLERGVIVHRAPSAELLQDQQRLTRLLAVA